MPYHDRRRPPQFSGIGGGLRLFAKNLLAPLAEQRALESDLMKSKILNRAAEDRQIRAEDRAKSRLLELQAFEKDRYERRTRSTRMYEQERYERRIAKKLEAEKVRKAQIAPPALQDIYYKSRGLPGGFTGAAPPSATGIKPLTVGGAETLKDLASLTAQIGKKGYKPQVKTQFVNFIGDDPDQPTVAGRLTTIFDFNTREETVKMSTWNAKKNRWGPPPPGYKPMQIGATGDLQQRLRMQNQTVMSPAIVTLLLGNKAARAKLILQGKLPKEGEPITYAHIKKMFPALKLEQLPGGVGFAIRKRDQDTLQRIVDAGHFAFLAGDVVKIAEEKMGVMDQPGVVTKYIDRMTASVREAWGLLKGWNRLGGNVTSQDIHGTGEGGYILDDDGNRRAYTDKDRTTEYIYGKGGDHNTVVKRALRSVTRDYRKPGGWLSKISGTAQARHVMESTIFSMAMALMASRGIKGSRISTKLVEKTIQEIGGVNLSYAAFRARMQSIMGRELKRMLDAGIVPFGKRLKKENIFSLWGFDADPLKKVKEGPVKYIAPGRKNPTPVGKDDQYLGEDGRIRTIGKKKEDNEEF
jgi:hypothetical protein